MKAHTPAALLRRIRAAAGPRVTVADDRSTASYLATCEEGYRFDQDLHELVACYWDGVHRVTTARRVEALADMLERIEGPGGYVPEPCDDPQCGMCDRA